MLRNVYRKCCLINKKKWGALCCLWEFPMPFLVCSCVCAKLSVVHMKPLLCYCGVLSVVWSWVRWLSLVFLWILPLTNRSWHIFLFVLFMVSHSCCQVGNCTRDRSQEMKTFLTIEQPIFKLDELRAIFLMESFWCYLWLFVQIPFLKKSCSISQFQWSNY